jgi:hypothetical protein
MFTVRFGGKGRDLCAMGCHPRASATIFSVTFAAVELHPLDDAESPVSAVLASSTMEKQF